MHSLKNKLIRGKLKSISIMKNGFNRVQPRQRSKTTAWKKYVYNVFIKGINEIIKLITIWFALSITFAKRRDRRTATPQDNPSDALTLTWTQLNCNAWIGRVDSILFFLSQ